MLWQKRLSSKNVCSLRSSTEASQWSNVFSKMNDSAPIQFDTYLNFSYWMDGGRDVYCQYEAIG